MQILLLRKIAQHSTTCYRMLLQISNFARDTLRAQHTYRAWFTHYDEQQRAHYLAGRLHCETGPALNTNYEVKYMRYGQPHRCEINTDGVFQPAVSTPDCELYYMHGKLHSFYNARGDLMPAVDSSFTQKYYRHGLKHCSVRDDDGFVMPAVIYYDHFAIQDEKYYQYGRLHRTDCNNLGLKLPARISSDMEWREHGRLHRTDIYRGCLQPAVLTDTAVEYWVSGKFIGREKINSEEYQEYYKLAQTYVKTSQ